MYSRYLGIRRQKFSPTDKTQLYGSQKYIVLIHQVVVGMVIKGISLYICREV